VGQFFFILLSESSNSFGCTFKIWMSICLMNHLIVYHRTIVSNLNANLPNWSKFRQQAEFRFYKNVKRRLTEEKLQRRIFFTHWSKFSSDLLSDMLIDLLVTINAGQDIHEIWEEYSWGNKNLNDCYLLQLVWETRLHGLIICYISYDNTIVSSTLNKIKGQLNF